MFPLFLLQKANGDPAAYAWRLYDTPTLEIARKLQIDAQLILRSL
jgi:hypothetical protein